MTRLPIAGALVLAVIGAGYVVLREAPARPAPPRLAAARGATAIAASPAPLARELLAMRLTLKPAQRRELQRLAAAWEGESAALDGAIAGARAGFEAFMAEARQRGGATLPEIQTRSAEFREASLRLRERRAAHGAAAVAVLTAEQRQALRTAPVTAGGVQ